VVLAFRWQMKTITFLKEALSDEGVYCVFAARSKDARKVQKFYNSLEQVAAAAQELDAEGYDVYFALATFEEAGSRKVDNVKHLHSFFLDLDCGPSKDFATQEEAIKALRAFCTKHSLPNPITINSGRGVHVYWTLTEAVCLDDWLPVAERLKKLCAEDNFYADPAVTSDAARVLRVPETHNYKTNPPSPVDFYAVSNSAKPVDFDEFSRLLGGELIPVPNKYIAHQHSATMDALLGNREHLFKDILVKTAKGVGCPQIKYIASKQEEIDEPLWRAGLSIAKFCSDYDKAIHLISSKHPDYSPQETRKKMDLIKGPYTCVKFDEFNPNVCPECPNWGKVKSPISLGAKYMESEVDQEGNYIEDESDELNPQPTQYQIPKFPHPYFRGANGGVYVRSTNADGDTDERCIYHNDLYVIKRVRDPELGESIVMRLHLPQDGVTEFTLPMSTVTSREEFRKALSMKGVAVMKMDELMSYTTHWVNELQANGVAEEAHRQFGWTSSLMDKFVLGGKTYTRRGPEFNPPSGHTASLFGAFEPMGTLDAWKENIEFLNEKGKEPYQYLLGIGFGSVLMEMSPVACSLLHLEGSTGGGKTTTAWAALGIWGNPEMLTMHEKDTENSTFNRTEVYHSLPMYIDEITNMMNKSNGPKMLSDLVYRFTSGRQKSRMYASTNSERHRGLPWSLIAVTSANASIVQTVSADKAMPDAEIQRVLEYQFPEAVSTAEDSRRATVFTKNVHNNYGTAGPVFIQYVIDHLDEVRELYEKVEARIIKKAKLTSANRFWTAQATAVITSLLIAKKIGLVGFDMAALFNWVVNDLIAYNQRRVADVSSTAYSLMNEFFSEHISNILQIKSTADFRAPSEALEQLVIPEQIARGQLVARYETDTKKFFVKPRPLKQWCVKRQVNYTHLVDQIFATCNGSKAKVRLTKGTHLNLPSADAIIMDFIADDTSNTNLQA